MQKTGGRLIAGAVLIAVGLAGLLLVGRLGWVDGGAQFWGGHWPPGGGPWMHGFGGRHMFGPWGRPGVRSGILPPVAGARTIEIEATDFAFRPAEIGMRAGEVVNLTVVNRGTTVHDLVVPAAGVWLVVPVGRSVTTGFRADRPGEYEFYCSVPGHREAGMTGKIVVTP
jgi:plastocyanin